MALIDMWRKDKAQISGKKLKQVIAFAGDGKLRDGSAAAAELREFLSIIPTGMLASYAEQCLEGTDDFRDSGLALQDIVNEIGSRIGFNVSRGRYRGAPSEPGHDGIWSSADGHSIVVEVKTTDAYRIDLDTIANYRLRLSKDEKLDLERSSMLVVVGRQDTGDLEAQIRGSRHAWEMRLISADALLRMLRLKEEVEDPSIVHRIHQILVPREFTRLDQIVDVAFTVVEDVRVDPPDPGEPDDGDDDGGKSAPVSFHAACIERIEAKLKTTFVKRSRATFETADGSSRLACSVSRYHERQKVFWFAFHPHQGEFLSGVPTAFVAFGCGDAGTLFLIPYAEFKPWLEHFNTTDRPGRTYWHVKIKPTGKAFVITTREGRQTFDITRFRIG